LFADRLEWEIASRASNGGYVAGPFASLPEDDPEEPFFRSIASEEEPLLIEHEVEEPASARGILVMAGLGVVAGLLFSVPAFWGLERMHRAPALAREEPHPTRAMAARAAPVRTARAARPSARVAPGADQVVAVLAPGPFPPRPKPVVPQAVTIVAEAAPTVPLEAAIPAATAPVVVANEEPPGTPLIAEAKAPAEKEAPATKLALKREAATKNDAVAKAERPPRAPPSILQLAKADAPPRPPPQRDACARSTPADRLVCSDLSLRLIDIELKDAYARALNARADPEVVGAGQSAWRRARDEVSDPEHLARLYTQRIRELEAAAAAARAGRPAG
jgi:uncharacterized protein YecT (DUF1311 family)